MPKDEDDDDEEEEEEEKEVTFDVDVLSFFTVPGPNSGNEFVAHKSQAM